MSIEHFGEYIQNINGTLERIRMVDSSDYAGDVNVQVMSMIPFKENVSQTCQLSTLEKMQRISMVHLRGYEW